MKDEQIKEVLNTIKESEKIIKKFNKGHKVLSIDELITLEKLGKQKKLIKEIKNQFIERCTHPNTTLYNKLYRNLDYNQKYGIDLKKNGKEDVVFTLNIDYETISKNSNLTINRLNSYDKAVYNAICTLYETLEMNNCNDKIFTLQQLYNVLSGSYNSKKQITPKAKEKIITSLKKLMCVVIDFNYEEHARAYNLDVTDVKNFRKIAHLINIEFTETTINGLTADSIELLSEPCLLQYSKLFKQLISTKVKYLERNDFRADEKNIIIRDELLTFIARCRQKKSNKTLVLATLYKTLNIDISDRVIKKRVNDEVLKWLIFWKEQNFINDYEIIRGERKSIKKITIDL